MNRIARRRMDACTVAFHRGRAEGLDGVSRRFDQRCTHHRLRCERKVLHGLRGMSCVLFLREHYKRLQPRRRPNSCNMQHATYNRHDANVSIMQPLTRRRGGKRARLRLAAQQTVIVRCVYGVPALQGTIALRCIGLSRR